MFTGIRAPAVSSFIVNMMPTGLNRKSKQMSGAGKSKQMSGAGKWHCGCQNCPQRLLPLRIIRRRDSTPGYSSGFAPGQGLPRRPSAAGRRDRRPPLSILWLLFLVSKCHVFHLTVSRSKIQDSSTLADIGINPVLIQALRRVVQRYSNRQPAVL